MLNSDLVGRTQYFVCVHYDKIIFVYNKESYSHSCHIVAARITSRHNYHHDNNVEAVYLHIRTRHSM